MDDLHKKTGITKSMLSRMETGVSQPSLAMARRLADAYQVPLETIESWLIEGS